MESNRQKKKKESNFVVQGSILAVASIVVRIIGIAYRIPMINIIGDEGMGYYGTAFNVYNIALLLSSYSLPLAVSKMVSARLAGKQYRNAARNPARGTLLCNDRWGICGRSDLVRR